MYSPYLISNLFIEYNVEMVKEVGLKPYIFLKWLENEFYWRKSNFIPITDIYASQGTGFSVFEIKSSRKQLKKLGLIETVVKKNKEGFPVLHYQYTATGVNNERG